MNGSGAHDQPILANFSWLATDYYEGTPWGNVYMPFTLNTWRNSIWYVQAAVVGWGGTMTKSTAWSYIDYDMTMGYPIAENVRYKYGFSYIPHGFNPSGDFPHWDVNQGELG